MLVIFSFRNSFNKIVVKPRITTEVNTAALTLFWNLC